MHREVSFPVAIFITRHAAGIGAKPFVAVVIDTDAEYIFVGQTMIPGEGIEQLVTGQVDFVDAERSTDPEPAGFSFDCQ